MQHRGGHGGRRISLRRPCVEWEERDEDAEAEQEKEINGVARGGIDGAGSGEGLQLGNVESALREGKAFVEADQPEEQDETADCEVNGDFPRRRLAFAGTPDADEQEGRDERELMEGVEKEEVERSERAVSAGRDEKKARIKLLLHFLNRRRDPDRGERDERGQQQKDQTQSIRSDEELQVPVRQNREARLKLKAALLTLVCEKRSEGDREAGHRADQCGGPRAGAEQNCGGCKQRYEDEES